VPQKPLFCKVSSIELALGLVHEWGLDGKIDESLASMTSGGKFSLGVEYVLESPFSNWMVSTASRWQDSSEMCAFVSLNLVSMLIAASSSHPDVEQRAVFKDLTTFFGLLLPGLLRQSKQWIEPDLVILAKSSLLESSGSTGTIHIAARLLLQATVERMATSERKKFVAFHSQRLTQIAEANGGAGRVVLSNKSHDGESETGEEEAPSRPYLLSPDYQLSTLLLGVIGLAFPQDLTPACARMVCDGLVEAIFQGSNRPHASMAFRLCLIVG